MLVKDNKGWQPTSHFPRFSGHILKTQEVLYAKNYSTKKNVQIPVDCTARAVFFFN